MVTFVDVCDGNSYGGREWMHLSVLGYTSLHANYYLGIMLQKTTLGRHFSIVAGWKSDR